MNSPMSRRTLPRILRDWPPDRIRSVPPGNPRIFLRHLTRAIVDGDWREHATTLEVHLERLRLELEADQAQIQSQLQLKRAALEEVRQLRSLLEDTPATQPGSNIRLAMRRRPGSNADLVVEELRALGGIQRAEHVIAAVLRRYPTFGGDTGRTQIYQILGHDPRIERVGRGLYKARPLR